MRSYPDIVGMRFGSLFDATQTMVIQVDDPTRYRLFLGMITRTATHLRWFVQSSTFKVSLILVPTRTVYLKTTQGVRS